MGPVDGAGAAIKQFEMQESQNYRKKRIIWQVQVNLVLKKYDPESIFNNTPTIRNTSNTNELETVDDEYRT